MMAGWPAIRTDSQPRYPGAISCAEAIGRLQRATGSAHHEFWTCDLSVLDPAVVDRTRIHGPRQVTDLYLLALATRNGGRFVTFDASVPLSAVAGARARNLVVI